MTNEKYLKLFYYFTLLTLFVLMSLLICGFLGVFNTDIAYADYQNDILNNSDAIVNFNQLILNDYIVSHTYSNNGINDVMYSIMKSDHIYYIKFDFDSYVDNTIAYRDSQSHWVGICNLDELTSYHYSNVFTCTVNNSYLYVYVRTNSSTIKNFVLIDLTQMFGENNIPSLSQCDNIFTSGYYSYNSGVAMPFNTITAYNQGVNDTLSTLEYDRLNYGAISSAFIDSSFNNSNAFVRKYFEPTNTDYSYYLQARGYLFIPFASAVNSGNLISFKYFDPGQGGSGNYLWCGVYNSNNFYPVMYIGDLTGETVSFASPVATQYLVFADSSTRDYFTFSDSAYWLGDFTVDGAKIDLNAVIDAAVRTRESQLNDYYNTYYGVNGAGYQAIYDEGYQVGLHTDVDGFARQYYTFPQFIGALFDVPVQVILSLLDFNVLGFNMKTLVLSILTITIVFALVRFVLAKQKGD